MTKKPRVKVGVMKRDELRFLQQLWHTPEVMRYADELPSLRGWKKSDSLEYSWQQYIRQRSGLGPLYTQLVIRSPGGKPIGESFFAPLPDGYTFGRWLKPEGVAAALGDLKLMPQYWGRGLGTEAMRAVVRWFFGRTPCELLVVPPHLRNPAAQRVYEKAGFELYSGMRSAYGHRVMELRRPGRAAARRRRAGRPN